LQAAFTALKWPQKAAVPLTVIVNEIALKSNSFRHRDFKKMTDEMKPVSRKYACGNAADLI